MNKLGLIIRREYLAKVQNRSFVVMTFLSPLLMVGMVLLIVYLTKLNDDESHLVAVLNESRFLQDAFLPNSSVSFITLEHIELKQAKDSVISLGYEGLLHIPVSSTLDDALQAAFLYTQGSPANAVRNHLESIFNNRMRKMHLQQLGITDDELLRLEKTFELQTGTFDGKRNLRGIGELKAFIGGGFGYLIMMFIIIYGGFVMRSVIEEKTSRIIEVIISSVKPFQLMLGKIIGNSLAGVTQFTIWIAATSILIVIAFLLLDIDFNALGMNTVVKPNDMVNISTIPQVSDKIQEYAIELFKIPWLMLASSFVLYFVLGYLIYSSIYAAIGAAVDSETDTQQFIFPIILPLMLGIYVGFFSVFGNPNGSIAVGFSLFPLTSPIVMLMRLPNGVGGDGVPLWQLILSIVLLIITFLAIVKLAAKIYRVGILMHGKKPTYKELYKWLKY